MLLYEVVNPFFYGPVHIWLSQWIARYAPPIDMFSEKLSIGNTHVYTHIVAFSDLYMGQSQIQFKIMFIGVKC